MADLQELQKQLNNIEELLGLLVDVSDEKIPQLKKDINDIVKNIKGGFDKEELATQIRAVLNNVINKSDYTELHNNIDATAKKLINAVETSSKKVDEWQNNHKSHTSWHYALLSGAFCFVLGACLVWSWQYQRIDKYQYAIEKTNGMSGFINSSCNNKQGYAKFLGGATDKKPYDCNRKWLSSTEILENN